MAGAYVIEPERLEDARGFFARIWCARELEAQGLERTLEDDTEVFYQMSEFYTPGAEGGVWWDDSRPVDPLARRERADHIRQGSPSPAPSAGA